MKEFVMTPAIEWLESEENEYKQYAQDIELISLKDNWCYCEIDGSCSTEFEFKGILVREVVVGGLELDYYDDFKAINGSISPSLKYLGVAQ